jgi:hypothetical protein
MPTTAFCHIFWHWPERRPNRQKGKLDEKLLPPKRPSISSVTTARFPLPCCSLWCRGQIEISVPRMDAPPASMRGIPPGNNVLQSATLTNGSGRGGDSDRDQDSVLKAEARSIESRPCPCCLLRSSSNCMHHTLCSRWRDRKNVRLRLPAGHL